MLLFVVFLAALLATILIFILILSKKEKEKLEFFYIMAHRLRSPISIAKWYIELLSDKSIGNLNEKQKEYFSEIYNASEKLNETLNSFDVFLRLQSNSLKLEIEKVDIKDLIGKILQKLQFKIEKHKLHLQEIYPKVENTVIQTDQKLIAIALQNLIENVLRHAQEDGKIDIKVDVLSKKMLIEIKSNDGVILKEEGSKLLTNSVSFKDVDFSKRLVKLILKRINAQINFGPEDDKRTIVSISMSI